MVRDLFTDEEKNQQGFKSSLSQWMTPSWVAEAIVEHALPRFKEGSLIIEPSCGIGRFLDVIPKAYPAIGVEIDDQLAEASRSKGHNVITGDFRTVALPENKFSLVIGNPPFEKSIFDGMLERSHTILEDDGQVVMIIPAYFFQTSSSVEKWNRKWSIEQQMVPRDVFAGLSKPLLLAKFTKSKAPKLFGFLLYHEATDIKDIPKAYKIALEEGKSGWEAAVEKAIQNLGGQAALHEIYAEIAPKRPTKTDFWKEKIRQTLSRKFQKTDDGTWLKAA